MPNAISKSDQNDTLNPADDRTNRTEDTNDSNQLPDIPIPFVVVDKVKYKEQSAYDELLDTGKSAAKTEPDSEGSRADSPAQPPTPKSPEIPLLVVETMDDKPAHGDDFSRGASSEEVFDKLEAAPLLSHEAGTNGDKESVSEEDEFDKAPLLSHETGFLEYKDSEATTDGDYEEENIEPQHYGPYDEEDEIPLLPHERESVRVSETGSGHNEPFALHDQPTFGYETDSSQRLFGGNSRPNYFRTRTNSSTLPNRLPRTDEDDDDLNDPSLEQFPTNRDQILERVQTIGLHLPEDEAIDEVQSPQFSVLSQACSSVDLAPVRSYTSLASVPEADYDEEVEADDDAESPTSPIMIANHASNKTSDTASDALATPAANASKQLHAPTPSKSESASTRTAMSSETESVDKHDDTKDGASSIIDTLRDAAALSHPTGSSDSNTRPQSTTFDSTLRERRKGDRSGAPAQGAQPAADHLLGDDAGTVPPLAAVSSSQHDPALAPVPHNETFLQSLIRVVLGPIGRLFTVCAGDRRRAR